MITTPRPTRQVVPDPTREVVRRHLSSFLAAYRLDGRGGAAYDPEMMLALLVYSYCVGERSSRRIERRLVEDVAFRVIAANCGSPQIVEGLPMRLPGRGPRCSRS